MREIVSATVFSESALEADALSTVLFLSGSREGERILKRHYPNAGAYLLLDSGEQKLIGKWQDWLGLLD